MKILSIIGSERKNSLSLKINNAIVQQMKKLYTTVDATTIVKSHQEIKDCKGCRLCFENQLCELDYNDNFDQIKKQLLEADLIILGIPVFLNNISGYMKSFFDRIAYWTHIYKLKGKFVIPIITTDSSGDLPVKIYVNSICTSLGLKIVNDICVVKTNFSKSKLSNDIKQTIINYNLNNCINKDDLEIYYQKLKEIYLSNQPLYSKNEKNYFIKQGFLNYDSFEELFKNT